MISDLLQSLRAALAGAAARVGAMVLLMLGVFRPESDRRGEAIGWLAILVLAGRGRRSWSPTPAGSNGDCSTAPSWSTASPAS